MNWEVVVAHRFFKDLARAPEQVRARVSRFIDEELVGAENPFQLHRLEKLESSRDCYKVRFGDYRVGVKIEAANRRIRVSRILHRREIYRYFP